MAGSSLLALLDDITPLLDDAACAPINRRMPALSVIAIEVTVLVCGLAAGRLGGRDA